MQTHLEATMLIFQPTPRHVKLISEFTSKMFFQYEKLSITLRNVRNKALLIMPSDTLLCVIFMKPSKQIHAHAQQ